MRNYIFLSIIALLFAACEEQELDPVLKLGNAPQLTAPTSGASFVLAEADADNALTTFTWSAADFGFQSATTYRVEMDKVGNNFADPITLISGITLESTDLTVGKLNNILLTKELPAEVASDIELRVCASVSSELETLCSDVVTISVTPFPAEVDFPVLNVPGNYQDWDPADFTRVVFSRKSDDVYEGYVYMGLEENLYKFARGSWDENWGDNEADGILDASGFENDITTTEGAGMYFLRADLNTLEHSNMRTDWGVIGDATADGWDADTDMTWDETKFALTATMDLAEGAIKFRANDAWDINFGDNFGNGNLQLDGENIVISEAGNYTIDLHLNQANYAYTLTKN